MSQLNLRHDLYERFKIKHTLRIVSGSSPLQSEKFLVCGWYCTSHGLNDGFFDRLGVGVHNSESNVANLPAR